MVGEIKSSDALAALLAKSVEEVRKMTPAQREMMHEMQRRSWARGEAGIGSDRDEAAYRKALKESDQEALMRLEDESQERMRRIK
jgi:hypothetical protein